MGLCVHQMYMQEDYHKRCRLKFGICAFEAVRATLLTSGGFHGALWENYVPNLLQF